MANTEEEHSVCLAEKAMWHRKNEERAGTSCITEGNRPGMFVENGLFTRWGFPTIREYSKYRRLTRDKLGPIKDGSLPFRMERRLRET